MLLSKKERIKYVGFNDFWFIVIGAIILSFVTDILFSGNSFSRYPFGEALVNWFISLFFCLCNWFIMRWMMIYLRKRLPEFKDSLKRIGLFFLSLLSTVYFVDRLGYFILSKVFGDSYNHISSKDILIPIVLISVMTIAIYEAIYYYKRLKVAVREEEQAKQVVVQSQLDALRNQAQPHFLFNSLNTLRDIIDQNSKDDAKLFVDKLANVYRFILESGNADLITLRDEVKFAKSYIHIQSERFGDNLKVDWKMTEKDLSTMIVPMSLQLLLENAIKHNVISRSNPLNIEVEVVDKNLRVRNRIRLKSTKLPSTKLGLQNIAKRYHLLAKTDISISDDGEHFVVLIPLLSSPSNT